MGDAQQIIEWLLSRGVQMVLDAPAPEYFRLTMKWKAGPNGRHKREITFRGVNLFTLLQKAVCQVDDILPMKISKPASEVEDKAGENLK